MSRRPTLLPLPLVRVVVRQFGTQRAAAAVIMTTVAAVSFLAVSAPRALDALIGSELSYELAALPAATRDLSASPIGIATLPSGTTVDAVWGSLESSVSDIRAAIPAQARALLGEGQVAGTTTAVSKGMSGYPIAAADPVSQIGILAGPTALEQVAFVEGQAPAAVAMTPDLSDPWQPGSAGNPIEIALSASGAHTLNWPIGQVRKADPLLEKNAPFYRLSGTFTAVDDTADYWQHVPLTTLRADVFDDGNRRPVATATAIVSPLAWPTVSTAYSYGSGVIERTIAWFPLDGSRLSASSASAIRDQLRQVSARVVSLGEGSGATPAPRSAFTTEVVGVLDTALGRSDAAVAVILVAASGPLGVAIAVLALAARLIAQRRSATLALITARGGSATQVRGMLGLEGLAYGLLASAIGVVAGLLVSHGGPGGGALAGVTIAVVVIAVAPAVLLSAAASAQSTRQQRRDLGLSPRTTVRRVTDITVSALAIAAVAMLAVRGVATEGVDPLLVISPVIVSLAVSLLVVRLYPLPLGAIERALARRTASAAHLGAARNARDPAAGVAPVLAMLVAVSVTVFSATMLATLTAGTRTAAEHQVGGDVRLAGPQFTPDTIAAVQALPGVKAAVAMQLIDSGSITVGRNSIPVSIVVADTAALSALQTGISDAAVPVPAAGTLGLANDVAPVIVSPSLDSLINAAGGRSALSVNGYPLAITSTRSGVAGSDAGSDWMLVDVRSMSTLARDGFAPRVLVVSTTGADGTSAVRSWAARTYGAGVRTSDTAGVVTALRASPFVGGLAEALLVVIVLVALLATFCVILMTTIGTTERQRTLALLRTLGFSRRQSRVLIAWELGPVAVVALIAGGLLGLALPLVALLGVDLRPFTGGTTQPMLALDGWTLAATAASFVGMIAATSLLTIAATRDGAIAATLRTGEE